MSDAEAILKKVKSGELSIDDAQSQLASLKIASSTVKEVTYKVSQKGAISFYGIRRMPITLYSEELTKIVDKIKEPAFAKFLIDNVSKLATKDKVTEE